MRQRLLTVLPVATICLSLVAGCGGTHNDASTASAPNGPKERLHGKARSKNTQAGGDSFENARKDPPVQAATSFAAAGWAEEVNQLPKAADLYRQTLKADPRHEQAMYRLGVITAKLRQYPESIDVWKRYVKLTNGSAQAYSNLAYTQDLAGLTSDAAASYEKGIARDTKNVACRVNYGVLLARQGKRSEALTQLQAVLTPAESHYNLGSVYELQGKKDLAAVEYQKALELDPNMADAQARLAGLDSSRAGVSRAE